MKKEHIHNFKKTGGSCGMTEFDKLQASCDDDYKCECGAWFKIVSQESVHFTLPEEIKGKLPPDPIEVNMPNLE